MSALYQYINSTPSEENYKDFQRIITSWFLPSQVILEVDATRTNNPEELFILSLICKMMLSTTSGCRNISDATAETIDQYIMNYIQTLIPLNLDGQFLDNTAATRKVAGAWKDVLSGANGKGWLNANVAALKGITDPLYDHLSMLPMYGGVEECVMNPDPVTTHISFQPPIFMQIAVALKSISNRPGLGNCLNIGDVFRNLMPRWVESLGMLNSFIRLAGETAFRAPLPFLLDLERGYDVNSPEVGNSETPMVMTVDMRSIGMLFKMMPCEFVKPERLMGQPEMESGVCAELQRLYSIIDIMWKMVKMDQKSEYTPVSTIRAVVEDTESNHFAKAIMKMCFGMGYESLFKISDIIALKPRSATKYVATILRWQLVEGC